MGKNMHREKVDVPNKRTFKSSTKIIGVFKGTRKLQAHQNRDRIKPILLMQRCELIAGG